MRFLLAAYFVLACSAYGQRISVGVVGGTNITGNYAGRAYSSPADEFNPAYRVRYTTGSRSLILSAMLEGHLSDQLSIEANVLHRPMKQTIHHEATYPDGSVVLGDQEWTPLRVWEFPILLKYTLPESRWTGPVRPFFAAGPSFRTQEDATATEPSQIGFSAGAGVALRLGRFRLSPTLRYTRWARDDVYPKHETKPDQVEFLASLSYSTHAESRRISTRKLDVGVIGGAALNDAYVSDFGDTMERLTYLAGLSFETPLKGQWAVEADAIYKPLRAAGEQNSTYVVLTWQFPVLAKRRWQWTGWTTFVAAGPSFRLSGNLNGYRPSPVGATGGAGLEKQVRGVRFSAGPRYTRWWNDLGHKTPERTNPHAFEMLFGVSFLPEFVACLGARSAAIVHEDPNGARESSVVWLIGPTMLVAIIEEPPVVRIQISESASVLASPRTGNTFGAYIAQRCRTMSTRRGVGTRCGNAQGLMRASIRCHYAVITDHRKAWWRRWIHLGSASQR